MKILLCNLDKEEEIKVPPLGIKFVLDNGDNFRISFSKQLESLSVMKVFSGRISMEPSASNHIYIK